MPELRLLAIAVACRRMGYVFFSGSQLRDWGISRAAARTPVDAAGEVQRLINRLHPVVVITEKVDEAARKGAKTKRIIAAVAATAGHNYVLDVAVARPRRYPNKYDEAAALAARYPEIKNWLPPRRRLYDDEPRSTVLFEALALATEIIDGPPLPLAAAMG